MTAAFTLSAFLNCDRSPMVSGINETASKGYTGTYTCTMKSASTEVQMLGFNSVSDISVCQEKNLLVMIDPLGSGILLDKNWLGKGFSYKKGFASGKGKFYNGGTILIFSNPQHLS